MPEPTLNVRVDGEKQAVPVSQVEEKDLDWYANKGRNQQLADIARAELERRGNGGSPAAERSTPSNQAPGGGKGTALALRHIEGVQLADRTDPRAITEHLTKLRENYNVVSPTTLVQSMPEGFEMAMSVVLVDPDPNRGDVYKVDGGKLGLDKNALIRIANAAGVSWKEVRRIDDHSDPHYCEIFVRGAYLKEDGTECEVCDAADLDLRDKSPRIEGQTPKAVKQARKFIFRTCVSMAMNRVINRIGVKRSYTPDELRRPFAVARLMFTGATSDPELRRMFSVMKAAQAMGSQQTLFGGSIMPALGSGDSGAERRLPPVVDADGVVQSSHDNDLPPADPGDVDRGSNPDNY